MSEIVWVKRLIKNVMDRSVRIRRLSEDAGLPQLFLCEDVPIRALIILEKQCLNKCIKEKTMKKSLLNLGIDKETISDMIEQCPEIEEMSESEIMEKINMLREFECNDSQIADIISSNPYYLDSIDTDIKKTINKLKEYGFEDIDSLLEGNPYILNLDDFEIENYIQKREKAGEKLEDIVDDMSSKPYLFYDI